MEPWVEKRKHQYKGAWLDLKPGSGTKVQFYEVICKKGFWFKIPSSPIGCAETSAAGTNRDIEPKDFFKIDSFYFLPWYSAWIRFIMSINSSSLT